MTIWHILKIIRTLENKTEKQQNNNNVKILMTLFKCEAIESIKMASKKH